MIHSRCPLSELKPIKPVVKNDIRLGSIEYSVKTFGVIAPIIIAKDKKILDGNKRWHVLRKMHGYDWHVDTVICEISPDSIWAAHLILNTFPLIPAEPARNLLDTIADSLKWRLLSELKFSATMMPEKKD